MFFNSSCRYGIKACIYLIQTHQKMGVEEIAKKVDSPVAFTSKILQKLSSKGLISSEKGRNGGFFVSDEQRLSLTFRMVFVACNNDEDTFSKCALGLSKCSSQKPCPIHHLMVEVKQKLDKVMDLKLVDLAHDLNLLNTSLI